MKPKGLCPGFLDPHECGPEIHATYDKIQAWYYWLRNMLKRNSVPLKVQHATGQGSLERHFIPCVPTEPRLSTTPCPTSSLLYVTLHQLFSNRRAPELLAQCNTLLLDKLLEYDVGVL